VARKITDVPVVACASPRYLAQYKAPRTPAELAELEWIHHLPTAGPQRLTLRKGRRQVTIPLRGRLSCNDGAASVQAAVHGFGIAVAPEFELGEEVRAGLLVPLLTDGTIEGLMLHAVFPPRRHVSAKVRAFADFVAERWRNPPWRLT
jgi:DNA-binding transcriptional LysR family regulator